MIMTVWVLFVALYAGSSIANDSRFIFSEKTVTDKQTGLIWTRNASLLGSSDWDNAFKQVKNINHKKYAGFNDWRLPSKVEMETLGARRT